MCFKRKNKEKNKVIILPNREVKYILKEQLKDKITNSTVVILSDSNYTSLSKKEIRNIYLKSNLRSKHYKSEVFDCDDFAVNMKSIVDDAARLNSAVTAPYAHGIVYGNIPTPHAINWFITNEKQLLFFEPQAGEYFLPKGEKIFFLYT